MKAIATTVGLLFLITGASANPQTPAEIVAAEEAAGNFGKSAGGDLQVRLDSVKVTGENEVTYFNSIPSYKLRALQNAETNGSLMYSLQSAIQDSPVDLENVLSGVTYKFTYRVRASIGADILMETIRTVTITSK